ncbi:MAG: T9SS type A sorting domain-containing protein, partial [Bacteroidales bacterium]
DVTYSTSNENAEVTVTDATDLFGSEAERTTTVEVVSQDGTSTVTYTIVFTVDNTSTSLDKAEMLQLYPVPATDFLVVKGLETGVSFDIIDITGSVVRSVEMNQPEMRLNISDLDAGVYFIRTGSEFAKFVKK